MTAKLTKYRLQRLHIQKKKKKQILQNEIQQTKLLQGGEKKGLGKGNIVSKAVTLCVYKCPVQNCKQSQGKKLTEIVPEESRCRETVFTYILFYFA